MAKQDANWLAAFALGMAFSGVDDDESCIQRLIEAANNNPDLVEMARGHVLGVDVGDQATRRRAFDLLDHAATRLRT